MAEVRDCRKRWSTCIVTPASSEPSGETCWCGKDSEDPKAQGERQSKVIKKTRRPEKIMRPHIQALWFATCSENARGLTSTKISMGISDIFASAPFLPLNALVGPDLRAFFFFLVAVAERTSSARQTRSVMREYAQGEHEQTFVRTRVAQV